MSPLKSPFKSPVKKRMRKNESPSHRTEEIRIRSVKKLIRSLYIQKEQNEAETLEEPSPVRTIICINYFMQIKKRPQRNLTEFFTKMTGGNMVAPSESNCMLILF